MKFIDTATDPWRAIADGAPIDGAAAAASSPLLDLAQWHSLRATWPEGAPVGVALDNDAGVETIAADLDRIALVALHFPKWTDGRAYSQARLLRVRHRFAGEIRASGDVLADMLPLLARTGFDAAAMRADQSRAVAERALSFFPGGHYQGDVLQPRPRFARAEPSAA